MCVVRLSGTYSCLFPIESLRCKKAPCWIDTSSARLCPARCLPRVPRRAAVCDDLSRRAPRPCDSSGERACRQPAGAATRRLCRRQRRGELLPQPGAPLRAAALRDGGRRGLGARRPAAGGPARRPCPRRCGCAPPASAPTAAALSVDRQTLRGPSSMPPAPCPHPVVARAVPKY